LYQTADIESHYRIVPSEKEARGKFEQGIGNNVYQIGEYKATLKGEHFDIDLGVKASSCGKNVRYGYTLDFTMGSMPWIEITHKTPNYDYNESTIINRNAQIKRN